jgi:endonuclease III related protein
MPVVSGISKGKRASSQRAVDLNKIYSILMKTYGPQGWWPGDSQIEIIAGALLTQATNWRNAASAVANLKSRGLLENCEKSFKKLLSLPREELERLIRPSGYFRQKADRFMRLILFLADNLGIPPWKVNAGNMKELREGLLELKGLGPETVDSILLYGFNLPVFVVDAYTRRVLSRHGMIAENASYEDIRSLFETNLPRRSEVYNEYHALIVKLGKEHCRSKPLCADCPLASSQTVL